jgi:hypothetical protein
VCSSLAPNVAFDEAASCARIGVCVLFELNATIFGLVELFKAVSTYIRMLDIDSLGYGMMSLARLKMLLLALLLAGGNTKRCASRQT